MQIFISYSSKSRPLVIRLAKDLGDMGHQVWYDQSLTGGQNWWATILENIRACDVFMIAVTEPYMDSKPCQLEYEYAFALKRAVVPVTLDKVNIRLLPKVIQELQLVEYAKVNEKAKMSLVKTLTRLPAIQPLPNPLPPEPDAPLSPLAELHEQIRKPRLGAKNQWDIVNRLRDFMRNPADADDAKTLLRELLQRDDLLLKVANEINVILDGKPTSSTPTATSGRSSSAMTMTSVSATSKGETMEAYAVERLRKLEDEHSRLQAENFDLRLQGEREKMQREAWEADKARIEHEMAQLRSKQVQGLIRQIDHEVEQGDWPKLLISTEKFKLQVEVENPALYFKRAFAYYEQGNLDAALAEYDKAIALDPYNVRILNNRGVVYYDKGELDLALTDYDKAIALDPREATAFNNRGNLYSHKGELGLALADYDKAISLDPSEALAFTNRGNVYEVKGELDLALADYNKAIVLDPHNAVAFSNRGSVYKDKGDFKRALTDYDKAIELKPESAGAYLGRGYVFYALNRPNDALTDFETVCRLADDDPDAHNNRAFVLFQLGRIDEAQTAWETSTSLPEAPHWAFAGHAVTLQKLGNPDLARTQYQAAIKMDAVWRGDLRTVADDYSWTPPMIELAREILKGIKRK